MSASAISGEEFARRVGAAFNDGNEAREAAANLSRRSGIDAEQIRIVAPDDPTIARKLEPETRGIARTLVKSHVTLGAAGLIIGLAIGLVLITIGVDLFATSPLYSVLVFVFFGAIAGLLLGGLVSLRPDRDRLAMWAESSVEGGRWLVLVHARDREEQRRARDALAALSDRVVGTP